MRHAVASPVIVAPLLAIFLGLATIGVVVVLGFRSLKMDDIRAELRAATKELQTAKRELQTVKTDLEVVHRQNSKSINDRHDLDGRTKALDSKTKAVEKEVQAIKEAVKP